MSDDSDLDGTPLVRIVCAAVRSTVTGTFWPGIRHKWIRAVHIMHNDSIYVDGFLDNQNVFHNREQAWRIASAAGQIRPHPAQTPGILHSEDLY